MQYYAQGELSRYQKEYSYILSRCGSSTCVICSRKCTAHRPPSSPPTVSLSPSRSALALNAPNTNLMTATTTNPPLSPLPQSHKRKKTADSDTGGKLESIKDSDYEEEGTSCGRMVCRNCCVENVQRYHILYVVFYR